MAPKGLKENRHVGDLPVCVLSLPDSEGRRHRISGMMEELGLAFEFRDAWSPAEIPDGILKMMNGREAEAERALSRIGGLLPTEVACYASHLGIISDVAEGRLPSPLLVLEDDAVLDQRSAEFALRLYRLMQDNPEIEYVNFNNSKGPYILDKIPVLDEVFIFVPWYSSLCMVAYMIRREGAQKIMQLREKGKRPVDVDIRYAIWENDLKYWECFPSMVRQNAESSTIDPASSRNLRKINKNEKFEKMSHMLRKHGYINFIKFYPIFLRDKIIRKQKRRMVEENYIDMDMLSSS